MRRSDKTWAGLDGPARSHPSPDAVDPVDAALNDLRERMVVVEQQVLAQYTASAAYATIARQDDERIRAEARADSDRAQATVIGLMEKLRAESGQRLHDIEATMGGAEALATTDALARLAALEQAQATLSDVLEATVKENEELRARVRELGEQRMRDEGWLASDGSATTISLR